MLFMKMKKLPVLLLAALFLGAAIVIFMAACGDGGELGRRDDDGSELTPAAADYDISGLSVVIGGTVNVQITPKANKSTGAITKYYAGSTTVPSTASAGTFPVTFDVAAVSGWKAAAGLAAGTLEIKQQVENPEDPVAADFTITGPVAGASPWVVTYDGTAKTVSITPKDDTKSQGGITIHYKVGETVITSPAAPSEVGTYTVTFDVAEAYGFNAATGLAAGTLTITAAPIPTKNYMSGEDMPAGGWGITEDPLTLGLTPGNTTSEIMLNWYSSNDADNNKSDVRFVRGTFTAGYELIEVIDEGTTGTAGASNTWHKAKVSGLTPGESYEYAVSSDGENWSEAYKFKVPAATGSFKFGIIADPQLHLTTYDAYSEANRYAVTEVTQVNPYVTGTSLQSSKTGRGWVATMAKIVNAGVSFIASGGDQVDTTANGNEDEYTLLFAPPGLRSLPLAPVSGNHDAHNPFMYHYNLPNDQRTSLTGAQTDIEKMGNYFYRYNNVLFVVLNTAPYHTNSSAGAVPFIAIFRQTLEAAIAAHSGFDWLIVQHHKSTASVADHAGDKDIQGYVEAGFESLMSEFNVDFVITGHDHVYARSYPLEGKDDGLVSVPDKDPAKFPAPAQMTPPYSSNWTNPGNTIYLTFTTASGLKYYAVASDTTTPYGDGINNGNDGLGQIVGYSGSNTAYPYLGIGVDGRSDLSGYLNYIGPPARLPVSNYAFVQPYIPSYGICTVDGKTITFATYPIASSSGIDSANVASGKTGLEAHSYTEDVAYDTLTVTKSIAWPGKRP